MRWVAPLSWARHRQSRESVRVSGGVRRSPFFPSRVWRVTLEISVDFRARCHRSSPCRETARFRAILFSAHPAPRADVSPTVCSPMPFSLTDVLTHAQACDSLSTNLEGKEAGTNGTSILREVQEEGGSPECKAGHPEEQTPGHQGRLPEVRNCGLPHRQSLASRS